MIVEMVYQPSCGACALVREVLLTRLPAHIHFREINAESPEGESFIERYGIVSTPAVLVDGKLLAEGITGRKEMERVLELIGV
ncbi:thioredoxin family protein [Methermicoccus shengliensis]|uniref:Thioredoxin family protein n=1 Tax=Methermicoccus shengliensis TaxID=660064 RepID=A0A832RY52_9EURY|nr:thioredoxin family protein [Methermicoccus shengliensis]KUK04558.1 MAG: hypothetical protein XD46_0669 [Euryarchaeota archaeon 55_53]KUK29620.1 MAG: hypothetical protein XD62_1302 [Methanosarcinales archeaon 56_1174]MDI3487758.1 Thioredoxin domain [Methanosarcinales archaeon]MDN5294886.1 Thioredoxin domain [Methanosarcinales archaeon]HIH70077.1 thioredoxin family protein [Methermicoccus shengliensis]